MDDIKDAQGQRDTNSGRFRIVSRAVIAMKRFQASLNPTYHYGKRSSDGGPIETVDPVSGRVQVQPQHPGGARTTSGRTASGRTVSGRPSSAGQAHGHKGSLLFRPLAPLPNDVTSN